MLTPSHVQSVLDRVFGQNAAAAPSLEAVRQQGRFGDTELAHVNPREKAMLEAMGGAGTRNPRTGLLEYYDISGAGDGWGTGAGDTTTASSNDAASFADPTPSVQDFESATGVQAPGPGPTTPSYGVPTAEPSFMDTVTGALGRYASSGPALVGLMGPPGMGPVAAIAEYLNNTYYGGQARADVPAEAGGTAGDPGSGLTATSGASAGSAAPAPQFMGMSATPFDPGDLGLRRQRFSYAEGGMVGAGGAPQRPPTPPNAQAIMAEAKRFAQQNPQQVQQIQAEVQESLQSGETNPAQLQALSRMAMIVLQQPQLYPQLRIAAERQGLIDTDDMPEQYDPGVLFALLLVGQALGGQASGAAVGQPPDAGSAQPPMASMQRGGALPARSPNADGSVPINAHEGEYVIPAHVVRAKGTEFFDKLIAGTGAKT
jgi:hypothetical protein